MNFLKLAVFSIIVCSTQEAFTSKIRPPLEINLAATIEEVVAKVPPFTEASGIEWKTRPLSPQARPLLVKAKLDSKVQYYDIDFIFVFIPKDFAHIGNQIHVKVNVSESAETYQENPKMIRPAGVLVKTVFFITKEEAIKIAKQEIANLGGPISILSEDKTMERSFGWVFFFHSKDPKEKVPGPSALIVNRFDGTSDFLPSSGNLERSIKDYEDKSSGNQVKHTGSGSKKA